MLQLRNKNMDNINVRNIAQHAKYAEEEELQMFVHCNFLPCSQSCCHKLFKQLLTRMLKNSSYIKNVWNLPLTKKYLILQKILTIDFDYVSPVVHAFLRIPGEEKITLGLKMEIIPKAGVG